MGSVQLTVVSINNHEKDVCGVVKFISGTYINKYDVIINEGIVEMGE